MPFHASLRTYPRRMVRVSMLAACLTLCAACASSDPPRSVATSTQEATGYPRQDERPAPARVDGSDLLLRHRGSSSCPGVISGIKKTSPRAVEVRVWAEYDGPCTTDLVTFISRIPLPAGVDAGTPLQVTVKYKNGSETLTTGG